VTRPPAPGGDGPHVCVAIVGFRNAGDIVRCLAALATSTWDDFDVVIVENGGAAAFEALVAATPESLPGGQPVRRILAPANLGFAGGVNLAIAQAPRPDAWWILNPDTEPEPGALTAMVERLQTGDCDAVGSVLVADGDRVQGYGGQWRAWLARAVSIGWGETASATPDARAIEARQTYILGASMLVSRRFVEVAGVMREDYFLYCEEVEWCLRALGLGLRLGFAAGSRVRHHQGATTGAGAAVRAQPRTPVFLGERNRLLLTRDLFPARLPAAAIASLALIFLRYARRGAWRQLIYALDGWRDGLADRRGAPDWITV
jgi:GT2 family glycosyltransferase